MKNSHSISCAANNMKSMRTSIFLLLRTAGEAETIAPETTEGNMVSADFRRQLEGFGLTTANILYRMRLLQYYSKRIIRGGKYITL